MKINLQAKNIVLTPGIHKYVRKRITSLEKLLSNVESGQGEIMTTLTVGKSTNHHKSGDVFHADCLLRFNGREFYSSADKEDLYEAVDAVRDSLYAEISKDKDRTQTLFTRGARSVKKMLKGLSKRNPFTSKY